jgi:hypothetical protein
MKTPGQILYEAKNPAFLEVIPFDKRHSATSADILHLPLDRTDWRFLTQEAQQIWERSAEGHHLVPRQETIE